jgi:polyhydroxyalkanoate synthesis regulator phasin
MFGFSKPKINTSMMVALTPEGKRLVESVKGQDYTILSTLEERSPRIIRDLAQETEMNNSELQKRLEILSRNRLVTIIGTERQ